MKNIFSKIQFHPLYLLVTIIVILTGNFNSFIVLNLLILVHEMGHIIASLIFKWKIDKIVILPYGMITIFKDNLNKPIIEEFVILIMGPLFQIIYNHYFNNPYHLLILTINLLPIYPLDGSKFLFLLFNKQFSYYNSYILIYIISVITILFLLINNNNLVLILMLLYLTYNLIRNIFLLKYTMMSFILDRYKNNLVFKKQKKIKKINQMKREYYHYFIINNKIVPESKIFLKMFDK